MHYFKRYVLTVLLFVSCFSSFSQVDTSKPVKVAIFIPLFADDVFSGSEYTLGKANLPKNVLPGLEFYNGVNMAIDSMIEEGVKAQINIYDIKKQGLSIPDLMNSTEFHDVGLIIAVISNAVELKSLSDQALLRNIPLISATYPNHVGVSENPYFVMLNSSFQTHLNSLYLHMQKYYNSNSIIGVIRKGQSQDFVKNYIEGLNKITTATPLKIKWVAADDSSLSSNQLAANLDSTRQNVVFVASPSENFGVKVVRALAVNPAYPLTVIGMPTWDGIKELDRNDCRNVNIVYTTPFLFEYHNSSLSTYINQEYREKFYSRPSDMVFKGYEITYHFTKLFNKYRGNIINNLSDIDFTLFNQFKLEPVRLKKTSTKPDLVENKKIYFVKKQQGNVKSVL